MNKFLSTVLFLTLFVSGCGYGIEITKPDTDVVTPVEASNSTVDEFHPLVINSFNKAEEDFLKIEDEEGGSSMHPDVDKCVCKGKGYVVQGDGHKTPCKYHGSKSSMEEIVENTIDTYMGKDAIEDTEKVVEKVAKETVARVSENCTCEDCDCEDCDCQEQTKPEVIVATKKPEVINVQKIEKKTAQVPPYQLIMFTATWCGPCEQMKNEVISYYRQNPKYKVGSAIDSTIRILNIDQYRDYYNALRGSNRSIPLIVEIENGYIKSVHSGRLTVSQILKKYKLER